MRTLPFRIAIPFVLTTLFSESQSQDPVYPFTELTEEMRARIDLKDGSVEDWSEVLGEPTLTPLDFVIDPHSNGGYDPSSYDFRIWLAWHDATDHLLVAAQMVDDVHASEYGHRNIYFSMISHSPPYDAGVWFYVDGDQSGGKIMEYSDGTGDLDILMAQAQLYTAFARTDNNDSNVVLQNASPFAPWVHQVPYADGGGGMVDSQPLSYVVEFFVTPFDRFIWDDPEQSVISDLFAGKTIGFGLTMWDWDTDPSLPDSGHNLLGASISSEDLWWESDLWAHGILVGSDSLSGDTAVESESWARIKASVSE